MKEYNPEEIVRQMREEYFQSLEEVQEEREGETLQCLDFSVTENLYLALELPHLQAVIRKSPVTKVPLAPSWLLGLIHFRGQIFPLLDLAAFFSLESQSQGQKVLILRETICPAALLVKEVLDIHEFLQDEIKPAQVEAIPATCVQGVLERKERTIFLLSSEALGKLITQSTESLEQ